MLNNVSLTKRGIEHRTFS